MKDVNLLDNQWTAILDHFFVSARRSSKFKPFKSFRFTEESSSPGQTSLSQSFSTQFGNQPIWASDHPLDYQGFSRRERRDK
jgi:hypothetical protein